MVFIAVDHPHLYGEQYVGSVVVGLALLVVELLLGILLTVFVVRHELLREQEHIGGIHTLMLGVLAGKQMADIWRSLDIVGHEVVADTVAVVVGVVSWRRIWPVLVVRCTCSAIAVGS